MLVCQKNFWVKIISISCHIINYALSIFIKFKIVEEI
uniref:Uncharacterized protein n=1 Tax=Rhizophora mucronata TaxID=61149 RepID=A0A2P2NVX1_RHIMU